ncbi:MAG: acylphosphatase [Cyanobacteria bacterium SZAS LIN-3]|nr:acylphosphatase [Cyanobacteria bacterium SZAS LIN-3]
MPLVARLQIQGRVQGVFFRQSTRSEALGLGVCGYVRNLDDGSVEACIGGERQAVEKLIDYCRKGPSRATVDKIHLDWLELSEEQYERDFTGPFTVR